MKKRKKQLALLLTAGILLLAALLLIPAKREGFSPAYLREELGIDRSDYTVLHEQDSHGGFHGDGVYFVVLDCAGKTEEMQKLTEGWRELPLPPNLHRKLYGGMLELVDPVGNGLIEVASDGCYYFNNRHSKALDSWDTDIEGKHSYNFSVAVFNRENNTLCLMCVDT